MNKWIDKQTFISKLKDGQTVMVGGFMTCGTPEVFMDWIVESKVKDLTVICNDAGYPNQGVGKLIHHGQVKKLIASHIGLNPDAGKMMGEKTLEVILVPQGTLAERIRAYGAGLGGVLTPTGVKTIVQENKDVIKLHGKDYLLEEALGADLALLLAFQSDTLGNLTYSKTARNFNPIMATAAHQVFAYVNHAVHEIDPEIIITPHVFIHFLVKGE